MSALAWGPALAGVLLTTDPRAAVVAPVVPERHDAGLLLPAPAFDPGRVPFSVSTADGLVFDFSVFALFLEPCLLYTSPSPRDLSTSRMPSSA